MDNFIKKISYIGVVDSDTESIVTKKRILTLLPFYITIPAIALGTMYLYFGHFEAFLIPVLYIVVSVFSAMYLYKTKKFLHFEILQLMMILLLPFLLMWVLGGFNAGSFVFIWAFYAPIAAAMYSENTKVEIAWFLAFILLLIASTVVDPHLTLKEDHSFPIIILDIFFLINLAAGLGGIYFLISHFINNIRTISTQLKRDRESLYNLTKNLKQANEKLEHLANSDLITELPNRLYFTNIVAKMFSLAKRHDKQVAILFLDLDGFKAVNDTLGHEAGDIILRAVGSRLKSIIRVSDTVARIGGDEFAIALGEITEQIDVEKVAKTIIQELNRPCTYKDEECQIGVSIGISLYPKHGEDIEELLKKADHAMYEIKKMGKNNYAISS